MEDDSEPIVKIHNKQYEKLNKVKKKKKFKVGDEVVFKTDGNETTGTITKIIKKNYKLKGEDGEDYLKKENELKLKEEKKEDPPEEKKEEINYFSRSKDNKWLSSFNKAKPFEYEGKIYPTVVSP